MAFRWASHRIPRLYGLDLKNNVTDVKDGKSLGSENVFQNSIGVVAKRPGNAALFANDGVASSKVQEIGTATLEGEKFYFIFKGGRFRYGTSKDAALTAIEIGANADNDIWWTVLQNKIYFVDGASPLKFIYRTGVSTLGFKVANLYQRPTAPPTTANGADVNFAYTVDNDLGESTIYTATAVAGASAASVSVPGNTGPQTLSVGDKIRLYARPTSSLIQWRNVTPTTGTTAQGTYGSDKAGGYLKITTVAASYPITALALDASQAILYTELGIAINGTAPAGMTGLTSHYGRLVGWLGSNVYVSKVSNPNSFPPDTAVKEAFTYGFSVADGENITGAIPYRENLYVFKDTKAAVFGGVGPDDSGNNAFSYRRLETNGIGCVAGKSLAVVGDESQSNFLIWLAQSGFYASNGDTPERVGEEIEPEVQPVALSNKRKSVALYHKRQGFYYCFVGTETEKTGWILDLTKDNGERVGWFKLVGLSPTALAWDEDNYLFGTVSGACAEERISKTASDFSDSVVEWALPAGVNVANRTLPVTSAYTLGDEVLVRSAGTLPAGVTSGTKYYAIPVGATAIRLALSPALAAAGTSVVITSQGTGAFTILRKKAIPAFYTTNWINFGSAAVVKKLAKPMILLDAAAQSINLKMEMAVDWYNAFFDQHTIRVTSSDSWGNLPWGSFVYGAGAVSSPKNVAIARRKARAVRYRFSNNEMDQDFNLKGIEQNYAGIRNRGELID